jgi:hypothetical protein
MSNLHKKFQPELLDPGLTAILNRVTALQSSVREQFDKLVRDSGMTPEQFIAFFSDSKHFTSVEWQTAQLLKQELAREFKINYTDPNKKRKSEKEIAQESKNRKSKLLGARKNWLPIR